MICAWVSVVTKMQAFSRELLVGSENLLDNSSVFLPEPQSLCYKRGLLLIICLHLLQENSASISFVGTDLNIATSTLYQCLRLYLPVIPCFLVFRRRTQKCWFPNLKHPEFWCVKTYHGNQTPTGHSARIGDWIAILVCSFPNCHSCWRVLAPRCRRKTLTKMLLLSKHEFCSASASFGPLYRLLKWRGKQLCLGVVHHEHSASLLRMWCNKIPSVVFPRRECCNEIRIISKQMGIKKTESNE